MEKKKCKVCGRELPLSDFKRNLLSPDGYVNTCTACQNKKRRSNIKDKELDVVTPPTHTKMRDATQTSHSFRHES